MKKIALRNLRIFFRDRSAVFFSLLAVFIIIGLYVLFLGDTFSSQLKDVKSARFLMDSWIMAGLLAVTSLTTTMGAFGVMVDDRSDGIIKDFLASPLSRAKLIGGYALSSFAVGSIMSLITLILAEVYIFVYGGELLSFIALLKVLGVIFLAVLTGNAMLLFTVSFFKSQNAYAAASTVIGTLIGFLTGIYVPIGSLPEAMQFVIKIFPISHAGALLRQIMMEKPASISFAGAPTGTLQSFNRNMGVIYSFGNADISARTSILYLFVSAAVFYILSVFFVSRKKEG
ncbi:MAG: ABC transporter permease [Bacillota bacterium]|nr:ABC transporter permease [Bacillota bacterium]